MRCPICGTVMKKIKTKTKFKATVMRCPNCKFVVFYYGISENDSQL